MKLRDTELREFLILQERIKTMTKRLDVLKARCRDQGTFFTKTYACVVLTQRSERLAGLADVERVFGRAMLNASNLINVHESQIVKISRLDIK